MSEPRPESVTIELPIPHRALSPNSRAHWRVLSKHKKAARGNACLLAMEAQGGNRREWQSVTIDVTWHGRTRKALTLDRGNIIASLKASEDGLQDAGLVVNDRGVQWGNVTPAHDKMRPRVVLTVTRTGGAA